MSLTCDELERLAAAKFGAHWPSKLASALGVSRAAVSRWKKEGIAASDRAAEVRAFLSSNWMGPIRDVLLPSPDEKGNRAAIRPWVAHMMRGYDQLQRDVQRVQMFSMGAMRRPLENKV